MADVNDELRQAFKDLERKVDVLSTRLEKISDSISITTQAATVAATTAASVASTTAALAASVQATAATLAAVQQERIKTLGDTVTELKSRQWMWVLTSITGAGGITGFINHFLGK